MIREQVKLARLAGRVGRYHTRQLVRPENVAEHTFNVMNLMILLTDGIVSPRALMHALQHDMGEYKVGDVPGPSKRSYTTGQFRVAEDQAVADIFGDGPPNLTEWEFLVFKAADNLDGLLKCREELVLGNVDALECGRDYADLLRSMLPSLGGGQVAERVRDFINYFEDFAK